MNTCSELKKAPDKEAPAAPRRICFVCTGNTCRSPMAAAAANRLAAEKSEYLPDFLRGCVLPPLEAFSAGLCAREGEPLSENAALALKKAGIPYDASHKAHNLTEAEAESFDLLVGITRRHATELLCRFPSCCGRIAVLEKDISDPFGGDLATYENCLSEIQSQVKKLLFPEDCK